MTKAVRIPAYGGPEVLEFEDVRVGVPGEGEVLVRHTAIGLNFADLHNRTGRYPLPSLPHALGGEAAGVVEATGPGVDGFRPGDRIVYATGGPDFPPGAYSETRIVGAGQLIPLPGTIDDVTAASVMTKGLTAQYLLKAAFIVSPGDTIVLHAAAGGVGTLMAQWARYLGCSVVGVVGSPGKAAHAMAHGCHHVLVRGVDDIPAGVRAHTDGEGAAVVYDSVGKDTFEMSLACLRVRGTLVAFGSSSGSIPPFDVFRLNRLGSLYLTSAGFFWFVRTRAELLERARDLFDAIAGGIIRVDPPRRYRLSDARQAHIDMESRATIGAGVLIP